MSRVRTHFCTLVARGYGAVCWPMKYGTNWTMPALTNNRLGSSNSSGALGTTVWPRFSKNLRNLRRTAAVPMLRFLGVSLAVESHGVAQLRLALIHPGADVLAEVADRIGQFVDGVAHAGRAELARPAPQPGDGVHAEHDAEQQPEDPLRHRRALRSARISCLTRFSTSLRLRSESARRTP